MAELRYAPDLDALTRARRTPTRSSSGDGEPRWLPAALARPRAACDGSRRHRRASTPSCSRSWSRATSSSTNAARRLRRTDRRVGDRGHARLRDRAAHARSSTSSEREWDVRTHDRAARGRAAGGRRPGPDRPGHGAGRSRARHVGGARSAGSPRRPRDVRRRARRRPAARARSPTPTTCSTRCPLTAQTRGAVRRGGLRARCRRRARFFNVGRGRTVDEPALVEALRAGTIAGAALDVFENEPLPADSPLWAMPNVIVSPHMQRRRRRAGRPRSSTSSSTTSAGCRRASRCETSSTRRPGTATGEHGPSSRCDRTGVQGARALVMSERVIDVRGLRKSYGDVEAVTGHRPPRRPRRGLRAARAERRRQDHDDRDPRGLPGARPTAR